MKNKKAYLQISFAWLFAIIVGIFILFLAIYMAIKIIDVGDKTSDLEMGKEIEILLNPLETSFQSGVKTSFTMPKETRIYNECNNQGEFGRQLIRISQKSLNKWTKTEEKVGFSNKYIFSKDYEQGKKFYVFSKPFEFPFKVGDLIYISSAEEKYCFVNPMENIKQEIKTLGQENLLIDNCSEKSIKVCFNNEMDCDILVNYEQGYVEKNTGKIYFEGDALMYAGIFAEKELYECQLNRLMKRTSNLALLYQDKASFISKVGCNSNLKLSELSSVAEDLTSSANLASINYIVEDIKDKNENAECRLW